jgi:hypothetical protein
MTMADQHVPHFQDISSNTTGLQAYLSAPTLEDLDEGGHGPSILEQRLERHLGLADGVGVRMGQGGQELGQLGGRVG